MLPLLVPVLTTLETLRQPELVSLDTGDPETVELPFGDSLTSSELFAESREGLNRTLGLRLGDSKLRREGLESGEGAEDRRWVMGVDSAEMCMSEYGESKRGDSMWVLACWRE